MPTGLYQKGRCVESLFDFAKVPWPFWTAYIFLMYKARHSLDFFLRAPSITNHWYRCKSMQWEQFSLNDIGFLQSTGTCPRCVQWKNSHPRKTPECHREAAGAGAGPDPGTKSSPHLLNKTILYNPVYAPTNVSRAFPNQHLRMGTVW